MPLTVLLGGARSGKSSAALSMAAGLDRPVTFLATATQDDDEMAERIDRHRRERPVHWKTIEEPIQLEDALSHVETGDTVIIDCLTLWLNNMMGSGADEVAILDANLAAATAAATRIGGTIAVTNEVGMGLVPPTPVGRRFRDLAGRANRIWVEQSARAGFLVAGRILALTELTDWTRSDEN